jgi:hypothetical protein
MDCHIRRRKIHEWHVLQANNIDWPLKVEKIVGDPKHFWSWSKVILVVVLGQPLYLVYGTTSLFCCLLIIFQGKCGSIFLRRSLMPLLSLKFSKWH